MRSLKVAAVGLVLGTLLFWTSACITCQPDWDRATCDIRQAEAIAGQVDVGLQALLLAVPVLPGPVTAAIVLYHTGLPKVIALAETALATYEAGHTSDWRAALALLTQFYDRVRDILVAFGQPDVVAQAKATVKAEGATAVLARLRKQGVIR
jgi:hypothetical protein